MAKQVGVVGLGIMGGAFAHNLIRAGWDVVGFDIDAARCRAMARAGVKIAPDAATLASGEAMVLGLKAGLDAQTVFDMVRMGAANSRVFELRAPMMVKDRYDHPSMKVLLWQKDMAVIGEFARQLGCPTPLFDATVPLYNKALKTGHA